jgi:predicted RNase H-like nuclease (RuvC/YqgF family)
MRQPQDLSFRIIKKLENEIVLLQDEQTALLRRKWQLEDEVRQQKKRIQELEMGNMEEKEKIGAWKKLTALLLAIWLLFLSTLGIDRK